MIELEGKWVITFGFNAYIIGSFDILRGFFDTITVRLEDCFRGSKYPYLMGKFYQRKELSGGDLKKFLNEINQVEEEFSRLTIEDIVWDAKDCDFELDYKPNDISTDDKTLVNYFQNEDGWSLISMIKEAIEGSIQLDKTLKLTKF